MPERIVPAFAAAVRVVPEIERERIQRASRRELTVLDATHPPTYYRAELVRAFPCEASVAFSEEEARRSDTEVLSHDAAVGRELVRNFQHLI